MAESGGSETAAAPRAYLAKVPVAFLRLDGRAKIIEAAGDVAQLTGLPARDLVGREAPSALAGVPALYQGVAATLAAGADGGPAAGWQVVSDGGRTFELRSERVPDSGGLTLMVAEVPSGVREKENEQARLLDSRHVLRQLPGAAWTTDRALRVTDYLGEIARWLDVDEAHIRGATIAELIRAHEPTDPAVSSHLAALRGQSSAFRYLFHDRWYEVHVEPFRDEGGAIVGSIGVVVDITSRKAAEERLETSESLLAESERLAHVGSWAWEIARDRVTWSEELYRIYGLDHAAFTGTYEGFLAAVHPDDRESAGSTILDALHARRPFEYDHRIVRPDGSIRALHTRGKVVTDERGKPVRMIGACSDVTEARDAQLRLESAVSLLEASLESTADGILVVDRHGRVVRYNQRFLALWRIPPSLAQRKDDALLLDFVVGQLLEPDLFLSGVHDLYEKPRAESFDVLRFKDGRVYERYSRPQSVAGEIVGRVWSFRDVSDRERLLRRALFLADAGRLLSSLEVETALDGVARLAVPILGDACAVDLFEGGAPRRLLAIARDPSRLLPVEIPPAVHAGHGIIYTSGGASLIGMPLLVRGQIAGAMTLMAPVHRHYTEPDLEVVEELARRAGVALENARLYRITREAVRTREEFLAVAAHEIRGPLTSMRLAVQMLHGTVQPEQVRLLEVVEREERRLGRLVDELLDLGRIQGARLHLTFEQVDLSAVAREVAARVSPDLAKAGSSLSMRLEAGVIGTWDRTRVDQVLSNLLSNAIKFGRGQPIEIAVEAVDAHARLTVADHGIGIPPDRIDAVFEPFERAVPPRHYGGLGLGLYVARKVVAAMGGTIDVHSEVERGSTFVVELPLEQRT